MTTQAVPCYNKPGWNDLHRKFTNIAGNSRSTVLLIGNSIVKGLFRYKTVWKKYFEPFEALNFGIGGDKTQNVLWRIINGNLPRDLKVAVIHCRTNNIDRNTPVEIKDGIILIVEALCKVRPNIKIIITGLLPRDVFLSKRREDIVLVNNLLERWCRENKKTNTHFVKPSGNWISPNGYLNDALYHTDYLHLSEKGNKIFAEIIHAELIKIMRPNGNLQKSSATNTNTQINIYTPTSLTPTMFEATPMTQSMASPSSPSSHMTSATHTTTHTTNCSTSHVTNCSIIHTTKYTTSYTQTTNGIPTHTTNRNHTHTTNNTPTYTTRRTPSHTTTDTTNGTTTHCTTYTITCPYTNTDTTATDKVTASPTTPTVTATLIDNTFTSTLTDTATPTTTLKDTTTHLTTPTDNTSATIITNTPTPITDMTAPADTTNTLIPQTDITAKDTTDSVITTDITTNPTDITASTITNVEMDTMTADTNTTNHPHNITNFRYFRSFLILCMFLTLTKCCVFTSVNESRLNRRNNYCNVYGNKTYKFLMREIGIFTGVGNGFQEAGMAYTSTNGPSLYKTDFHLTHLKKAKHTHNTGRPIPNISIAKIVLLPLLSVILVTIGHWFAKISSLKYVNFKHRYLFFGKLRKCPSKHKIIYALHKIFLLLLIALLYNVKVPAKTYHNIESKTGVHHELFMGECFASTETSRTSCLKEQYSLYVLSKLKYSKHCWYLQYILLLSGDINLTSRSSPISVFSVLQGSQKKSVLL